MSNRSMVEVFNIVKGYHYLYKVDGQNFMCLATDDAYLDGKITNNEACRFVSFIREEMQEYADCYIPKENNYKVDGSTSLYSVIMETLDYSVDGSTSLCSVIMETLDYSVDIDTIAERIIPSWWDSFYEKLKLLEE